MSVSPHTPKYAHIQHKYTHTRAHTHARTHARTHTHTHTHTHTRTHTRTCPYSLGIHALRYLVYLLLHAHTIMYYSPWRHIQERPRHDKGRLSLRRLSAERLSLTKSRRRKWPKPVNVSAVCLPIRVDCPNWSDG